MKKRAFRRAVELITVFCFTASLAAGLTGCEALTRKFTRKSKDKEKESEPVLIPQEYPSLFKNTTEAYRQYLFYWKSWQDELLNSISNHSSSKKKVSCVDEGIKNLAFMKNLLREEKQKGLEGYIKQMADLRDDLRKDRYGSNGTLERMKAESLKRNILRDYSYEQVKGFLKDDFGTN
ncbi:MAG: hypothetical protein WC486_03790 [Candidatus Omnitrophota bacterium]|nr:hypothetical protein [Candidatus Omnitrophota bacterium]